MTVPTAEVRSATARSKRSATSSGSVPGRMMSLPPAQKETRSGASSFGPRELVLDDLVEQFAAHGEVGVAEVALGPPVREKHREPVGPADEGPVGAGVADALGEAVPHRHVRPDH